MVRPTKAETIVQLTYRCGESLPSCSTGIWWFIAWIATGKGSISFLDETKVVQVLGTPPLVQSLELIIELQIKSRLRLTDFSTGLTVD